MTDPQQLLEQSLTAYGGWENWKKIKALHVQVRIGGWALTLRGQPRILSQHRVKIFPEQPYVRLFDFPKKGTRGGFLRNKVWIENSQDQLLQERADPRNEFKKFRRKFFWDTLDVLYFASYALWNYLTQPFLLQNPDITLRALDPWKEDGHSWSRLEAIFPSHFPTHSPRQVFYFDENGFIVRHDYTATVFGDWAKAAHYSYDFKKFQGLYFPLRRRVWPRKKNNFPFRHFTLVALDFDSFELEY
jgi:hypothetical protein